MFQGYSDETFEFFMAIRFNNNRPFFLENRDWYLRAVREPSLALAQELSDVVEDLDPDLERRPHRVVSRINRDIRFSKDKSPYRDYLWLAFRKAGEERATTLGVYFDIDDERANYGMGFYKENASIMSALRARMEVAPGELLALWRDLRDEFVFYPHPNKRLKVPEGIPEELHGWYTARSFYVEHPITDFDLIRSPALAEDVKRGYARLKPLYRYILNLRPKEEEL